MTEAIFGFIGVMIGSLTSYFAQIHVTKLANQAELSRLSVEARIRDEEKKLDLIREYVAELLFVTDPDISTNVDHKQITRNILRLQLILEIDTNIVHRNLNGEINQLGALFLRNEATRDSIYSIQDQILTIVRGLKVNV